MLACRNCEYSYIGYNDKETHMAELRCTKTSKRGRCIDWAFDTINFETGEHHKGVIKVCDYAKTHNAPNWCPLLKETDNENNDEDDIFSTEMLKTEDLI